MINGAVTGRVNRVKVISDKMVAFSIASEHYDNKEKEKKTTWVNAITFNKLFINKGEEMNGAKIVAFGEVWGEEYNDKLSFKMRVDNFEISQWPKKENDGYGGNPQNDIPF